MSWITIVMVVFIVLWAHERSRTKSLRAENRRLLERLGETAPSVRQPAPQNEQDAIDSAELAELRERIQVLERIATDDNSSEARKAQHIAREIESLRGDIARRSSKPTEDLSE
jgi:hypothetical protein